MKTLEQALEKDSKMTEANLKLEDQIKQMDEKQATTFEGKIIQEKLVEVKATKDQLNQKFDQSLR